MDDPEIIALYEARDERAVSETQAQYGSRCRRFAQRILGSSEDGTWYHIRSGNVDGYAAAEYIVTGEDAEELADEAGYTTAEVGA